MDFSILKGKTLINISGADKGSDRIEFETIEEEQYVLYHEQDCCECVSVEDVVGNINDLLDSPLLESEEVNNSREPYEGGDSCTWTFYKLSTIKGSVVIRWLGSSNGYYSESVTFDKV